MITDFLKKESSGGLLLMIATALAIVISNSPLSPLYELILSTAVEVRVGALEVAKPLLLWINDGLMAVFFFLIGLELKREVIEGELADRKSILLPAVGAVGGMIVPAAIYAALNSGDSIALQGWAIPTATDIAFALGILALLGNRVPVSLRIFLTSLAIFDDLGAILIIAFFYTANISITALYFVVACIVALYLFNRFGVTSKSPYIVIGIVLWLATLKSGVHATLAGVVLALFVPMRGATEGSSPLKELEKDLHNVVAFFVLPAFAFANAGISLRGITLDQALHGVPIGIAAGLFFGKQIGVFGLCWLAIKSRIASLPDGMNMKMLYGTAALCGVGFTMSLFIGSLAFEETGVNAFFEERLGIILGSVSSGILGYCLLRSTLSSGKSPNPGALPARNMKG